MFELDGEFRIPAADMRNMRLRAKHDKTYKAAQMGKDIVQKLIVKPTEWWANATLVPAKSLNFGKNLIPQEVLYCVENFLKEEQKRNETEKIWKKQDEKELRTSFRKKVSEITTNARSRVKVTRPRMQRRSTSASLSD